MKTAECSIAYKTMKPYLRKAHSGSQSAFLSRERAIIIIIAAIALFLRVLATILLGINKLSFGDERNYWEIAQSLVSGDGFLLSGRPTAAVTPIFPIFVAVASALWKTPASAKLIQAILASASVFFIYKITLHIGCNSAAKIAAVFYAMYLPQIYLTTVLYPQLLGTVWTLLLFIILIRWHNDKLSSTRALLFGAFIAIGTMLIPMLLVLSVVPSYLVLRKPKKIIVAAVGFAIILAPWIVRNTISIGKPVPLSTAGWMNFWAGNCKHTTPSSGSYPIYRTDEGKRIRNKSEASSAREFRQRAIQYISQNPKRTAYMLILKFINFWRLYPTPVTKVKEASAKKKLIYALFWIPVLILSIVSIIHNRNNRIIIAIVLSILLFAAGYAVFFTRVRFRLPIEPLLICIASTLFCKRKLKQSAAQI